MDEAGGQFWPGTPARNPEAADAREVARERVREGEDARDRAVAAAHRAVDNWRLHPLSGEAWAEASRAYRVAEAVGLKARINVTDRERKLLEGR